MFKPKICIIILNLDKEDFLLQCLKSFEEQKVFSFKIVVLDNGSRQGSLGELIKKFPEVDFIFSGKNLGFAEGNNFAIKKAKGKYDPAYYFLLNNDTIMGNRVIFEMVSLAESDSKIGIIGPKILSCPDKEKIWAAGGKLISWRLMGKNRGEGKPDKSQYDKIEELDFVSGCAMLIRKEVFEEIGFFDSRFFTYLEDLDLCLRAKKKGWKIFYQPKAIIYHYGSVTSGNSYSYFQSFYRWRNKLLLIKNQANFFHKLFLFFVFFPILMAYDSFRYFKKGLFKEYKELWKGLKDFFTIKNN